MIVLFTFLSFFGEKALSGNRKELSTKNLIGNICSLKESSFIAVVDSEIVKKGSVRNILTSSYNENGDLIEETDQSSNGIVIGRFVYKYDRIGNLVEKQSYNSESLEDRNCYKYDNSGHLIEESLYKSNNSLLLKIICRYNNKGQQIERDSYRSDGNLFIRTVYRYDNQGNEIEEINYDQENHLDSKTSFKYDSKGNKIEENIYNSDDNLFRKYSFRYDKNSNLIERCIYFPWGSLISKFTYRFDNNGNPCEENSYNSDGTLKSTSGFIYSEFDKRGNWLKKVKLENGKPVGITCRDLEYY